MWPRSFPRLGPINTAITNVIGAGLRDISSALNAVNGVLNSIQSFFQNTIYPLDAINRARGVSVQSRVLQRNPGSCKSQRG